MGKPRDLWLTKVNSGRYLITKFRPVKGRIRGTRTPEMESPFDPLLFPGLCETSVKHLLGSTLPPLTPTRIRMKVDLISDGS